MIVNMHNNGMVIMAAIGMVVITGIIEEATGGAVIIGSGDLTHGIHAHHSGISVAMDVGWVLHGHQSITSI